MCYACDELAREEYDPFAYKMKPGCSTGEEHLYGDEEDEDEEKLEDWEGQADLDSLR